MKTPEEIAAELAADVWEPFNEGSQHDVDVLNRIESFVSASIRKARRDGAEAMREMAAKLMQSDAGVAGGGRKNVWCRLADHMQDNCECLERASAIRALPLPGDEPKSEQTLPVNQQAYDKRLEDENGPR